MKLDDELSDLTTTYNNFITMLKGTLKALEESYNKVEESLKELEGSKEDNQVKRIYDKFFKMKSTNDIVGIINMREILIKNMNGLHIEIDANFEPAFKGLNTLYKHNSFNNPILESILTIIESYVVALNKAYIDECNAKYNAFMEKGTKLLDNIEKINELFDEEFVDMDTLVNLCNEYNISTEDINKIKCYIVVDSLRRSPIKVKKHNKVVASSVDYNDVFKNKKVTFDVISSSVCSFINKYSDSLRKTSSYQKSCMEVYYSTVVEAAMTNQSIYFPLEGKTAYEVIQLYVFIISRLSIDINDMFSQMYDESLLNRLNKYMYLYKFYGERLKEADEKLTKQEKDLESLQKSTIYVLADGIKTFIDDDILNEYGLSIAEVIAKEEQSEFVSSSRCGNIMKIKIDKQLSAELGDREVLCYKGRANKSKRVAISYIFLNHKDKNNKSVGKPAILVISASAIDKDGTLRIETSTKKVIKDNINLIKNKIHLLEYNDPDELLRQNIILNSFAEIKNGRSEKDGRKAK